MLSIIFIFLKIFVLTGADSAKPHAENGDVIVVVTDIQDIKGDLLVGIYDSKKTFRKIHKVMKYEIKKVEADKEVFILSDIPTGTYAIALFQDFNGNRKFDYNWMGMPKEPFGFSTNFVVKRKAPKYKDVTFIHDGKSDTELSISIQVW